MPPPSPSLGVAPCATAAQLRAQDWGALRARVFGVAWAFTKSRERSEELADAVLADCLDPQAAPWNPREQPDLVAHAFRVLKNRISAEHHRKSVRQSPGTLALLAGLHAPVPTPSERLEQAESHARARRLLNGARSRLAAPLDSAVLDLLLAGVDQPPLQAAQLNCQVTEIYRARDRISMHSAQPPMKRTQDHASEAHPRRDFS